MKALRGTLSFVLGIIIGIILFVLAIGGTVVALGTAVTIGDLQNKFGYDLIDENSEAYNQSILSAVKSLIQDIKDISNLSLQDIIDTYGIKLPEEISGINITKVYEYPISEISNHVGDIIDSIKLGDVLETAGITADIPIINDNKESGIRTALNDILASVKGNNLSLDDINTKFGISLGADDNALLKELKYIKLNDIGGTINYIQLNNLLDANTDTYVAKTSDVYIKVDQYEEISKADLKNASYIPNKGVETYVYGLKDADNNGTNDSLAYRELRYVKNASNEYVVDNSSYAVDFDADASTKTFYRHVEYKLRNGETGVDYYVESFANAIDIDSMSLISKGFIKTENTTIATFSTPLLNKITATPVTNPYYDLVAPITKDSKLEESASLDGYVLLEEGTASAVLQAFAYKTLDDIQSDDTFVDKLTLGEIITIDSSSSNILQTLKDTTIGDLSAKIDTLCLYQIMDIVEDNFTADPNGNYVRIEANGSYYYTMFNPAVHGITYPRYSMTENPSASSKVLQRLRTAKINTFSDDFKTLVLSDVLDIVPSIYDKVTYANKSELTVGVDYFYYDETKGLYLLADDAYITAHNEVYRVAKLGEGNKLIQRLAYVKVDDLSSALETIIDDTYISDIIDVIDNYAIEATTAAPVNDNEKFLIEDTNSDGIEYVYNTQGNYMIRYKSMQPVDTATLNASTQTLTFAQVADRTEAIYYAGLDTLFYSKDGGATFVYNPQLTAYILAKSSTLAEADRQKLYHAVIGSVGPLTKDYTVYSDSNLYIETIAGYVPYVKTQISHIVQTNFFTKVSGKAFVNINDPVITDESGYAYNSSSDKLFSRVYCETIYVASATGNTVFYDNAYVAYDPSNPEHATLTRYNGVSGYIASTLEAYEKISSTEYQTELISIKKATITIEKSANLLIALKNTKTTMKNMGSVVTSLKLEDVIDITPDSIFAIEYTNSESIVTTLQECSINELSYELSSFLSTLTVGDLIRVSNITSFNPQVKQIIKDIDLTKFFGSLTYKEGIGVIVDLEEIYG